MLNRILREISARTPGFRGAAVVGMDGMTLVQVAADGGPELELFSAECSALLKSLGGMVSQESCGRLRSLATEGERWNLLVERVTDEYFLLLVVAPEGPLGRGRHELRRAALALEPELI